MSYVKLALVFFAAMGGGGIIARRCSPLTMSDLGTSGSLSTEGIISQATNFSVQINRFNILCLSSADFMDRYQSVSVLVGYFCPACPGNFCPACPGNGTMDEIVEQFTFDCGRIANASIWDSSTVQRAIPMSVDFNTPLDRSCGLCEHPDRLDPGVPLPMYNESTHCISCNVECREPSPPNSGLCYQNLTSRQVGSEMCCPFFDAGRCVDNCLPTGFFRVPDPITSECARPTFRINGGDRLPIQPAPVNTVVYVHDESRGATSPLNILCLYGDQSQWLLDEGDQLSQLLDSNQTIADGSRIDVEAGLVTISPTLRSTLSFTCQSGDDFEIIVTPENPYLFIFDLSGGPSQEVLLSDNDTEFMLITISAYTLDGLVSIEPVLTDFRITIAAQDGTERQGVITNSTGQFPIRILFVAASIADGIGVVNLIEPRANVTVEVSVDGGSLVARRSIQVIRETLPSVPAFSLLLEGDPFTFDCTPTTNTSITYSSGFSRCVVRDLGNPGTPCGDPILVNRSIVHINETNATLHATEYGCSAYEDLVVRQTFLIVFPVASSGLEIFDVPSYMATRRPSQYILGPRRNQNLENLLTPLPPFCVGRSGHGDLEWFSDDSVQFGGPNSELQERLRDYRGVSGTHEFTVGQLNYTVTYSTINGSNTINMASLDISGLEDNPTFVGRFKCFSRESGEFKFFTITSRDPIVLIQPSQAITVSLGQQLLVDIYVASTLPFPPPIFSVNGGGVEAQQQFTPDPSNPQHEIFEVTVVPELQGFNEFSYQIGDEATLSAGFNVTVTTPTLRITAPEDVREFERIEISCMPSDPNVRVRWLLFDNPDEEPLTLTGTSGRYDLYPPNLNHRLRIESATASDSRIYVCEVDQNPGINVTVSVRVRRRCGLSVYAGIVWGPAFEGDVIPVRCRSIDPRFSNFVRTSRTCLDFGWSPVDFGSCTLREEISEPFILVWLLYAQFPDPFPTDETIANEITAMIDDVSLDSGARTVVGSAVASTSAQPIVTRRDGLQATPVLYSATLSKQSDVVDTNLLSGEFFPRSEDDGQEPTNPRIVLSPDNQGLFAFQLSSTCGCIPDFITTEGRGFIQSLWPLCAGFVSSPCRCGINGCQCVSPFLGNSLFPDIPMASCVPDSDRDMFPDVPLSSFPECAGGCLDTSSEDFISYCCADTCPFIYNPDQSRTPCRPSADLLQCLAEADGFFGFQWGFTTAGETVEQPCGVDFIGNATRVCSMNGTWMDPDVSNCLGVTFALAQEGSQFISELLATEVPYDQFVAEMFLEEVDDLATATEPTDEFSRLPMELQASASFVQDTVDYLLLGVEDVNLDEFMGQSESIVRLLSNLVSPNNLPGSMQLMEMDPQSTFSEDLLYSAEGYGLYLSTLVEQSDGGSLGMTVMADNILVNGQSIELSDQLQSLTYPSDADLVAMANDPTPSSILDRLGDARIVIPAVVLRERGATRNMGSVRVSNVLFQNIEQFLPTDLNGTQRDPVTLVLSSQVEEQRAVQALTEPVTITFIATNQSSDQNFVCVFFDFDIGAFSTEGVMTQSAVAQGKDTAIECTSNHLTSFAVLINVAGVDLSSTALSAVSYIGLVISLACLLLSIIFFLSFGESLFTKGVHHFVHLNLAIALFLAYLLFAVGVELAAKNVISCRIVTAFLHYLFLAVFCCMLSEGVMLYLMLVVVFSTLAKKWWFFMLLGWLPPIPFVIIGLATVLDQYGSHIDGKLTFCWLASGNGQHAIWTFVAPMLLIMLINVVFLVLVISSLIRSQRRKIDVQEGKRVELVKNVVKASIILLPLLGLTWIFGLLIVNRRAIVFAWIFTLLNTLQGVSFFFLHVLRHERIWGRFKKRYTLFQSTTSKREANSKAIYKKTDSTAAGSMSFSKSKLDSSMDSENTKFMLAPIDSRRDTKDVSDERELTKEELLKLEEAV